MTPDAYTLRAQSFADLQRAELTRKAERIARIIERRTAELSRITATMQTTEQTAP